MTPPTAAHALAIVAALAKRAGGRLRVEYSEIAEPFVDVAITTDATGITAEIVVVDEVLKNDAGDVATPEDARAAVERANALASKIAELLDGAQRRRGPASFVD